MHWRTNHFETLLIENWDEEYTVFQPDSGKTHFLNQMSMKMLIYLDQKPATLEEISAYLAVQFQQEPDHDFQRNIEKVLYHFDTLGLVKKSFVGS